MSAADRVDEVAAAWLDAAASGCGHAMARALLLKARAERSGLAEQVGEALRQLLALGELG